MNQSVLGLYIQFDRHSDCCRRTLSGVWTVAESDVGQCGDGFQFGLCGDEQFAVALEIESGGLSRSWMCKV